MFCYLFHFNTLLCVFLLGRRWRNGSTRQIRKGGAKGRMSTMLLYFPSAVCCILVHHSKYKTKAHQACQKSHLKSFSFFHDQIDINFLQMTSVSYTLVKYSSKDSTSNSCQPHTVFSLLLHQVL